MVDPLVAAVRADGLCPRGPPIPDAGRMIRLRRRHGTSGNGDGTTAFPEATRWMLTERSPDDDRAPFVARIAGVGRSLPPTHLTTDALMATTRHRTHIDLERLTGIHERRVSVGDEDSLSLAVGAARDCLETAIDYAVKHQKA